MLKGTLIYAATMKGLQFDGLEIQPPEPTIEKMQLASPDGKELQITVTFSAVGSQDEAQAIAARVIQPILDRLAFKENKAIGFPTPLSATFSEIRMDDSPDRNLFASDYLSFKDDCTAVRVMHPNDVAQLKAHLDQPVSAREQHYAAFRQALNTQDFVDQYMSLYRILLDLRRAPSGNECQPVADDFIHREFGEPQVTPPGRSVPETVYTRLRNEVGHVRQGVVPDNTRQEIRNRLGGLINIAKRAIELS